jgi:transcriptional regulator with XRE-family HTH domain
MVRMAADQGPVVQSALLRGELIRLRKDRDMTQEQVAHRLEWSPSKLIRIEGGRSSITKVDLDALLNVYGLTSESQRERLAAFNRTARDRAWWDTYREDADGTYLQYVGYEAGAAFIRQFPGTVVPGLLQTREYAEVIIENSLPDAAGVGPALRLRMQRQAELAKRSLPPRQYYVLDEAVVRRHVGIRKDPAIMPNQLRYIADRAESEDLLTVRVIPFNVGAHAGLSGPFTLLEFEGDLPDILYLDAGRGTISMIPSSDPQVAEYRDKFEVLLEEALPADRSIEFIRTAAEDMF